MTVTFTINFAYIVYPIAAVVLKLILLTLVFTVLMASMNAQGIKHWFQIVSNMLLRPIGFSLAIDWLLNDILKLR